MILRGLDVVSQLRDTATEAMRSRRDPVLVAQRRRDAARRRVTVWSLLAIGTLAIAVRLVLPTIGGTASFSEIGTLALASGLFVFAAAGVTRSGIDFRSRGKLLRNMPPAQPARRAITGSIRPLVLRLDSYSDALRASVGVIGLAGRGTDDLQMRQLRDETLQAADAAEVRLRDQAAEYSAMMRSGPPPAGSAIAATSAHLRSEIEHGVHEYGQLVAAASTAAAASRKLSATASYVGSVAEVTERLAALSAGMRELLH